jgi:hypothetical protein
MLHTILPNLSTWLGRWPALLPNGPIIVRITTRTSSSHIPTKFQNDCTTPHDHTSLLNRGVVRFRDASPKFDKGFTRQ